ncbi:unnamed protein product, partial [Symbiodinium sp. KB8]
DCIAEDDYVKGHYNQNTNYNASRYEVVNKDGTPGCRGHNNKHHEHNESQPGARQQLPHPRYGDESFDWADTSFENCQKILEETLAASATGPKRPIQHGEGDDQAHAYVTYGMFTHGGVHGTTRATKEDDGLIQYLNHFGRQHLGEEATWTSISVTRNIACDTHRDSNNLRDTYNYATSFGQRAGGDLWLEEDVDENHANDRDIVWKKVGPEIKKFLRNCGFPLHKKGGSAKPTDKARPSKSQRKGIMNAAGKVSVLMATLLAASASFMAEAQGPPAEPDPIVMMEIGGYEGTIEATELNKAVIEPILWEDFVSPD